MLSILVPNIFNEHPLVCAVSMRPEFGNMSKDPDLSSRFEAEDNRQRFYAALGLPSGLHYVRSYLSSGRNVLEAKADIPKPIWADILVTKMLGMYLCQDVGDCLSICLFDPATSIVMLMHVGYVSVQSGTIERAIEVLTAHYGVKLNNLLVWMPPALQGESARFTRRGPKLMHPEWDSYLAATSDGAFLVRWTDRAYNKLLALGVHPARIERSEIDTGSDDRFYSSWRTSNQSAPNGRHSVLLGMKI